MKNYTKTQEKHLLNRAERYRTIDEIRKMNTRQGRFERSFHHYDWHDDFAENDALNVSNDTALAILGRRDFSLRSPANQVQFNLDFEYFDAMIKHNHPELYDVFQAAFCGRTWQELSMPKRTFNWKLKKLENILAHLD